MGKKRAENEENGKGSEIRKEGKCGKDEKGRIHMVPPRTEPHDKHRGHAVQTCIPKKLKTDHQRDDYVLGPVPLAL